MIEKPTIETKKVSALIFGPLPNQGDHIGGSKVSFRQMVHDLSQIEWFDFEAVNISRPLASVGWLGRKIVDAKYLLRSLWKVVSTGKRFDVWAVHVSAGGLFNLFPTIYWISRLYNRPVILRVFGGDMDTVLESSSGFKKWLFNRTSARTHKLLLQTHALTNKFKSLGNVDWFPTTRNLTVEPRKANSCRKLLFMSQVREDKGVRVAVEACRQLPRGCTLDFFGSPVESEMIELIAMVERATYHRELKPPEVPDILRQYDVLLLPTFHKGEGFPGILIEAFQCGIPVIASAWRQIPEVVQDGVNGLLVEPNSVDSLAQAIERITSDDAFYRKLAAGALQSGANFNSVVWNSNFANWCLEAKIGNGS